MRRFGYIRTDGTDAHRERQRAAMRSAWVGPGGWGRPSMFVDEASERSGIGGEALPMRARLLEALREGDLVVVESVDRIAIGPADMLRVLQQIGERGAGLHDLETGATIDCAPDAVLSAAAVERACMRLGRLVLPADEQKRGGRKPLWTDQDYDRAAKIYFDQALTNDEVAEKAGIPYRTLFTRFGPRRKRPADSSEA